MVISLKKLQHLKISDCQMMEDIFVNLQPAQNPLTWEEVKFPSLERLEVFMMDNLKSIYNDELASNPFPKLNRLVIFDCKKLLSVFPSYVLNNLCNLEKLDVRFCYALKVIFNTQGLYNVSMELQKLQVFNIVGCGVESIVSSSEMVEEHPRFVFPQLASLKFWFLGELKSFYPGIHTLDSPSLKILNVDRCDNLEFFQSKSQNSQEIVPFHGQPLFSSLKAIPRIGELNLRHKDIANICSDDDLYSVTYLRLHSFTDELERFPIGFLQRFTNLDHLEVERSNFTEIFSCEDVGPIMNLKTLSLHYLPKLEHLCKGKSEIHPILQNIKILKLKYCSRLTTVIPSSSSQQFQNLDELWIYECCGLVNIITLPAATIFLKLRRLTICDCEMLEAIVAKEDDSHGSEISFKKLEHLELIELTALTSFCKGNLIFNFPLLQTLRVVGCPRMETFTHGILIAPMLTKVLVNDYAHDEWRWEGELNTTIQKMFEESVSQS